MRFAQIQGNSDNIGELGRDVHAVRNSILEKRKDGTHMNVIAFVGELTELSEIRTSAAGNRFATMMIRVQRPFANSEGVYEYDHLNIMLWKGIAETAMAAAQVGDHVSVKGRMQSHTFEGQDGKLHRSYDLIAEHVSFIKKER